MEKKIVMLAAWIALGSLWTGCETTGTSSAKAYRNDGGSDPANKREMREYRSASLRCFRTGGSRIVKLEGVLRCF